MNETINMVKKQKSEKIDERKKAYEQKTANEKNKRQMNERNR